MSEFTAQSFRGVDLHKYTVSLAAVDAYGVEIAHLKISTKSVGKIEDWLLALPRSSHMAVEAYPFVEWFIHRFGPCVDRIDIADVKESAGRTQSGNITKAGSACLRWALCQAAVTLCMSDARQEAIRQRLIKRIGKPKANVAMGRRLLRILCAMVRDEKKFQRGAVRDCTSAANKARLRRKRAA